MEGTAVRGGSRGEGSKPTGMVGDGYFHPLDGKTQAYFEILMVENRLSTREKKSGRAEDLCTVTTLLCKVEKSECDGGISGENMVP